MANIFDSALLKSDYEEFKTTLNASNRLKFDVLSSDYDSELKKIHQCVFSLLVVLNKATEIHQKENKFIFLNEIISDSLTIINLFFLGFNNASQILLRRLIENYYNHLYFFNHEIEFILLENGKNDYVQILEYKKYVENHPLLKGDDNNKIFNDDIFNKYQEQCKFVHTKGSLYMSLATNLSDLKPEFDLKAELVVLKINLQKIVYIFYKFHREITLENEEKNILFKSIEKKYRSSLSE